MGGIAGVSDRNGGRMEEYKQLIIARKDLSMSPGKLASQVSHGSMAFLTSMVKESAILVPDELLYVNTNGRVDTVEGDKYYLASLWIEKDLYEGWINGSFTKVVCEAKNRDLLMKAVAIAEELGLKEGRDFWLIKDNCRTELEPEEVGEDGVARCLTVVGFRPLPADVCEKISKKFQLYR